MLDGVVHNRQRRDQRQANKRRPEARHLRLCKRFLRRANSGVDDDERSTDGGQHLEGGRLHGHARDLRGKAKGESVRRHTGRGGGKKRRASSGGAPAACALAVWCATSQPTYLGGGSGRGVSAQRRLATGAARRRIRADAARRTQQR
jgi:hypothetical protein